MTYTYIQSLRTERGYVVFVLRSAKGKRVRVSRKRFNELVNTGRVIKKED